MKSNWNTVRKMMKASSKCPVTLKENYRGDWYDAKNELKKFYSDFSMVLAHARFLPQWIDSVKAYLASRDTGDCVNKNYYCRIPGDYVQFKNLISEEFKNYRIRYDHKKTKGEHPKTIHIAIFNRVKK